MTVELLPGGGFIVDGPHISLYRILVQISAIKLECKGLRYSGGSVTAKVKKEYGFKGNREKVLAQLQDYYERVSAAQMEQDRS